MSGKSRGQIIECIGLIMLRLSIVFLLFWVGSAMFTARQAYATYGLFSGSIGNNWIYSVFSIQTFSNIIGTIQIVVAILLLLGLWLKYCDIIGSFIALILFTLTTIYVFRASGLQGSVGGFPGYSILPGQFLFKNIAVISACLFFFGRALDK